MTDKNEIVNDETIELEDEVSEESLVECSVEEATDIQSDYEENVINIGLTLSEKRDLLGLSIEDVASELNILKKQILALESNEFSLIINPIFCQGYLRNYAVLLDLDPQPLVDELNTSLNLKSMKPKQAPVRKNSAPRMKSQNERQLKIYALLLLPFVVLFLAYLLFNALSHEELPVQTDIIDTTKSLEANLDLRTLEEATKEIALGASATNTVLVQDELGSVNTEDELGAVNTKDAKTVSASQENQENVQDITSEGSDLLVLQYTKEAWTEIYDAYNKRLIYETKSAGSIVNVKGTAPFYIKLGIPFSADILFNGNKVAVKTNATNSPISFVLE